MKRTLAILGTLLLVSQPLAVFADDIGMSPSTVTLGDDLTFTCVTGDNYLFFNQDPSIQFATQTPNELNYEHLTYSCAGLEVPADNIQAILDGNIGNSSGWPMTAPATLWVLKFDENQITNINDDIYSVWIADAGFVGEDILTINDSAVLLPLPNANETFTALASWSGESFSSYAPIIVIIAGIIIGALLLLLLLRAILNASHKVTKR